MAGLQATADGEITALLAAWAAGHEQATDDLFERLYPELRRLARQRLLREPHTALQATELAHEVFLRLARQNRCHWHSREQFFALSSTLLRRVLVDRAKHRLRRKRGSGVALLSLDEVAAPGLLPPSHSLLDIDRALEELAEIRATAARVVELLIFAGLSLDETAHALNLGRSTVQRRWRFARSWLARRLS
ncbi:MAG: ECF-type sigma factor [Acidobacteriota bacterium]